MQINRDNVTLQGGAFGAGIAAPPGARALVRLNGADDVVVRNLALTAPAGIDALWVDSGSALQATNLQITGGRDAVHVQHASTADLGQITIDGAAQNGLSVKGSSVNVNQSTISGSGANGVFAQASATVELYQTTVTGSVSAGTFGSGVVAANDGASIEPNHVTVENTAGNGVMVFNGGTVNLGDGTVVKNNDMAGVSAMAGHVNLQGADVENNGYGFPGEPAAVSASWGSTLVLQGATVIESNAGNGVDLNTGSAATFQASTVVKNNGKDGVHLRDTSVARLESGIQILGNGNWGVFCEESPAVAVITGTTPPPGGNGSGEISCPATP